MYYQELDILGFDKHWRYEKSDAFPYMWAEANTYWYRGRKVAQTKGGSLYTAPELILIDDPEPYEQPLRFVDVPTMVEKNLELLEKLAQDTIKKIFNTYVAYKDKADIFYVAFSGGKDSIVVFDLVQRALPHNAFQVLFGNTDMEFPSTLKVATEVREYCSNIGVSFHEANASYPAIKSWELFGPPSRKVRWCCSVHKTAPVVNKLGELLGNLPLKTVMITGVRADESTSRAEYDEISIGKKITGQHSFHPILEWTSAEVFLYIYWKHLILNDLYKLGFGRVGCIMCPNSSERHEFIKRKAFSSEVEVYCDLIVKTNRKDLSGSNRRLFLDNGGWKARFSGRELRVKDEEKVVFHENGKEAYFTIRELSPNWEIWYKTMGDLINSHPNYRLEYKGEWRNCRIAYVDQHVVLNIEKTNNSKNYLEFIYLFKNVLIKSQYCIQCMACVSECPYRNIKMRDGSLSISDKCIRCHACLRMPYGCQYYNSIRGSTDMRKLKGVNRYLSVGVDAQWIENYLHNDSFEPGNRKTDVMFGFMNDAGITTKRKLTSFGKFIVDKSNDSFSLWSLMLCNLVYTPAFNWYVLNVSFCDRYEENRLTLDMGDEVSEKAKGEFWNGFKVIISSNEVFQQIGLGFPEITETCLKNGEIRKSMHSVTRVPWRSPDPRVILYSLFKFAEACGDYYAFTLSRLMNHDIDSDGVSPTQIFGLGREEMEKLLVGLSVNYPDFINTAFMLGLDNITLNKDKSAQAVLTLF